jgi:hypothetical protein
MRETTEVRVPLPLWKYKNITLQLALVSRPRAPTLAREDTIENTMRTQYFQWTGSRSAPEGRWIRNHNSFSFLDILSLKQNHP